MASIRAVPTEAEYQERNGEDIKTFTKWRLIDWGVVSHGSNPAALARSVKEAADSLIVEEKKENCLKRKVQAMEIELL